jgi:hypothetical protein
MKDEVNNAKDEKRPFDQEARSVQLWKERYEGNLDSDANGMVSGSPNSHGLWNARLNDTTFWMRVGGMMEVGHEVFFFR